MCIHLASTSVLFSARNRWGWEKLGVTHGDYPLFSLDVVCVSSSTPPTDNSSIPHKANNNPPRDTSETKVWKLTVWNFRSHLPFTGWDISGLLDCLTEQLFGGCKASHPSWWHPSPVLHTSIQNPLSIVFKNIHPLESLAVVLKQWKQYSSFKCRCNVVVCL